jgi:glutaredoxin
MSNNKNNYYIKAILLDSCPYSAKANRLLFKYNIPHEILYVTNETKDIYKTQYISTYPQIYLNKLNNKGNLLLGGYTDLKNFINTFRSNITLHNITTFMKDYKWSKKSTLRLIQLINEK